MPKRKSPNKAESIAAPGAQRQLSDEQEHVAVGADDDPAVQEPEESEASEINEEEAPAPKPEPPPYDTRGLDAREALARKREAELREKEKDIQARRSDAAEEPDEADEAEEPKSPPPEEPAPEEPAKEVEESPEAEQEDLDRKVTVMIDGRPVEKRLSEVIADAQQLHERKSILDETRRILDEAKAIRQSSVPDDGSQQAPERGDGEPSGTSAPSEAKSAVDKARIREVVREIQSGDEEDAAEKLAGLVEELAGNRGVSREEVMSEVRSTIERDAQDRADAEDLRSFIDEHPTLVSNQPAVTRLFEQAIEVGVEDLAAIGMSAEDVARVRSYGPSEVRRNHEHYRNMRNADGSFAYPNMRRGKAIWDAAGDRARSVAQMEAQGWGILQSEEAGAGGKKPVGAATSQSRQSRKASVETSQSRTAGDGRATARGRMEGPKVQTLTLEEARKAGIQDRMRLSH